MLSDSAGLDNNRVERFAIANWMNDPEGPGPEWSDVPEEIKNEYRQTVRDSMAEDAARQPPQPTGDVDLERLRIARDADYETGRHLCNRAADLIESLVSRLIGLENTTNPAATIRSLGSQLDCQISENRKLQQALGTAPEPPQNFIALKPVELLNWGIGYRKWWRAALTGAGEDNK